MGASVSDTGKRPADRLDRDRKVVFPSGEHKDLPKATTPHVRAGQLTADGHGVR
jgi:hypothetical protein